MTTPEDRYNNEVDFEGARLEVLPLYNHAVPGFSNKIPILFQFVTGRNPDIVREPFSLAVVLDVSGSMQGNKLKNCKSVILQLIDATEDDDRLTLVTYSASVRVVFENARCGDDNTRKSMKDQVLALQTESSTNLYDGLLEGYNALSRAQGAVNKHIFLLSDGQVNEGKLQRTESILQAVSEWEDKVPILSYGIGDDFNEKLMSPLGQTHRGSHYFYITDAASIERLIARGIRALTSAVARNVRLEVTPMTSGLCFPDHLIDGAVFPLVREKSVIQYMVEVEARPDVSRQRYQTDGDFEVVHQKDAQCLRFYWEVVGMPQLEKSQGRVSLEISTDRSFRKFPTPEVETYIEVKRACELRRSCSGSAEARKLCEQALQILQGRISHDRFGFAEELANKTQSLLQDESLWIGNTASAGAAKHLGVAYAKGCVVEEEDEEEELDFDLFG